MPALLTSSTHKKYGEDKRKMLIIVAGPDRAGKTTLINRLVADKTFDFSVYKGNAIERPLEVLRVTDSFLKYLEDTPNEAWLCDRFYYPDDIVYRPIKSGEQSVLSEMREQIEERLKRLDTLFIHVTASLTTLQMRYRKLGEDPYLHSSELPLVLANYKKFFEKTSVRNIEINTDIANEPDTFNIAKEAITDLMEDIMVRELR